MNQGDISTIDFTRFPGLIQLSFPYSELIGTIPDTIGTLSSLTRLALSNNALTGTVPTTIVSLPILKSFEVGSNQLSGPLPDFSQNTGTLEHLSLGWNSFIPSRLDDFLMTLPKYSLKGLWIGGSKFSGSIPTEIVQFDCLTVLVLYTNDITGTIPSELGTLTKLYQLHVEENFLTGKIPLEIAYSTSLRMATYHRNDLTGLAPTEETFCNAISTSLQSFVTDCAEPEQEVPCSCCTGCWSDTQNQIL